MNSRGFSLVWICKTDSGWRRFPVVIGRNGRIKHGIVNLAGREVSYPDGHYEIRSYVNRQPRYENVGSNATEALFQLERTRKLHDARSSAAAIGLKLDEPQGRKTIKAEAARWVQATKDRGAMEAAVVNEAAIEDFLDANPRLFYVDEISADTITGLWRYLKRQGKADRTVYNVHLRITGFLKFARVDYRSWNLRAPRFEKKLPDIYGTQQLAALLKACRNDYQKVLVLILTKTGLRDQELQHLTWADVDLNRKLLRVRGKDGWNIKDYEQRDIPLSKTLVPALKAWRAKNPKTKYVLGTTSDKLNTKYLPMLKGIANRAKIEDATLHRFRRTYATTLLQGGMDLRTVQLLMGHSDIESTMRYLAPASGSAVSDKINSILG